MHDRNKAREHQLRELAASMKYKSIGWEFNQNTGQIWRQSHEERVVELITKLGKLASNEFTVDSEGNLYDFALLSHSSKKIRRALYNALDNDQERLCCAVIFGWFKTVSALIEKDVDVETQLGVDKTVLYLAAAYGRLKIARLLLDKGADVNPKTKLYDLLEQQKSQALKARLTAGHDPLVVSPLYAAVKGKHYKVMKLLLKHGANAHQLSLYGVAIKLSNYECISNVNLACLKAHREKPENAVSAMHIAAEMGDVTALSILLKNDPRLVNMAASFAGKMETVPSSPIERFWNGPTTWVNKTFYSLTPLHVAVSKGHVAAVDYLIRQGADINQAACNPLNRYGGYYSLHDKKQMGMTPLHIAAKKNDTYIMHLLLSRGARINVRAYDDDSYSAYTPLEFTLQYGDVMAMQLLLSFDTKIPCWEEAMQYAASSNKVDMMAILLARKDGTNLTPLMGNSVEKNSLQGVQLFLAHGAKVTDQLIELAKDSGFDAIAQCLENALEKEKLQALQAKKSKKSTRGFGVFSFKKSNAQQAEGSMGVRPQ